MKARKVKTTNLFQICKKFLQNMLLGDLDVISYKVILIGCFVSHMHRLTEKINKNEKTDQEVNKL